MRWSISLVLAAWVAGGCVREPAGPTIDFDEEQDAAEARAFCASWEKLCAAPGPQPALQRARLAYRLPTGVAQQATCLRKGPPLLEQGLKAAEVATEGIPTSAEAWMLLGAYRYRLTGDPVAAGRAICEAAKLAPHDADALEACGDALVLCGNAADAVRMWRQAFDASAERPQQFELISKIQNTSKEPAEDLASLPPGVVEQYRDWRKQQRERRYLESFH